MSSTLAWTHSARPYPGLRPYLREEADIFFGREEQVDQILERLKGQRFLALVGTSGCGKSSLARAGMIAALEAGLMSGSLFRWRVATMRPGTQPLQNLADALLEPGVLGPNRYSCSVDLPAPEATPAEQHQRAEARPFVLAALRRGPLGLAEVVREPLIPGTGPALPEQENLLVVVDQFEEIFRFWHEGDRNEAEAFVALLLATVHEKVAVYVVLTMRSDYLGDCALFSGLPEMLNDSQFLTPRPTREQRRAAIEGPARVHGGRVEPALVGRLLNDMGAEPDQLPLMQHVLMRLWNRNKEGGAGADGSEPEGPVLRLADYEELGGLTGALDRHSEEIYASLTAAQRPIAETLFRCLSERDARNALAGSRDTRRPTRLRTVAEVAGVPAEQVIEVANVFRGSGLNFLTPGPEVPLTPDTLLDVSHESLLRRWGLLQQWVEAEAKSADIYRRLADNAKAWKEGSRADYLDKLELAYTVEWEKRERPNAAWAQRYGGNYGLAMEFLRESEEAERRRAAEEQAAKKWKVKKKYLIWLGIVAFFGIAVALGLVIWILELKADAANEKTRSAEDRVKEQTKLATAEKARADYLHDSMAVLRVTTKAESWFSIKPQRAVLMAVEGWQYAKYKVKPPQDQELLLKQAQELLLNAEDTLRKALSSIGGNGLGANQGPITHLAASEGRDGALRYLAAAGQDGTIALWERKDRESPPVLYPLSFGYRVPISRLFITRGGRWLIAKSGNAPQVILTAWDLDTADKRCKVLEWAGPGSPTVVASAEWLLAYAADKVLLFKLGEADLFAKPVELTCQTRPGSYRFSSFSQKGKPWLALVTSNARAFVWDLQQAQSRLGASLSGTELPTAQVSQPGTKPVKSVVAKNGKFTGDGTRLIVCLGDGTVRSWEQVGEHWGKQTADEVLREGCKVTLATDLRGLRAVVAERRPAVNQESPAYLFDLSQPGARVPVILDKFDESIDTTKYLQVDENSRWLAAARRQPSQELRLWKLKGGDLRKKTQPTSLAAPEGILEFRLSSDGRWLVTRGGAENFVRLWSLGASSNSRSSIILRGHDEPVSGFAFSEGNRWLITRSRDGSVRYWSLLFVSPSIQPYVMNNQAQRNSVLIPPGNRWLVVAQPDGAVRFWDLHAGEFFGKSRREPCLNHADYPSLQASDDGRWLVTYGGGDSAQLWDLNAPDQPLELGGAGTLLPDLYASPDGRWLASTLPGSIKGPSEARLWDLRSAPAGPPGGKVIEPHASLRPEGYARGFVASGKALLTETPQGYRLWHLERLKEIDPIPGREKGFLTPKCDRLITQPFDTNKAKVYNLSAIVAGEKRMPQILLEYMPTSKEERYLSANGRWLFTQIQGRLSFWNLGSEEAELKATTESSWPPSQMIPEQQMSPDQRWLITWGDKGRIKLWNLSSEGREPSSTEIGGSASWGRFTADSSWLVVAADNKLRLYRLTGSGVEPGPWVSHSSLPGTTPPVSVSRNRRWLAVVEQNSMLAWDLTAGESGDPVVLPNIPNVHPSEVFLSADGGQILAVDQYRNSLLLASVTVSELLKVARRTAGRNLSRAEWQGARLHADLGPWRRTFDALPELPDPPAPSPPSSGAGTPLPPTKQAPLGNLVLDVPEAVLTAQDPLHPVQKRPYKEYVLSLQAGKVYVIDMKSKELDSYLRLLNPAGKLVEADDDSGGNLNAQIVYVCPESGRYKIIATIYSRDPRLGKFQLTAQEFSLATGQGAADLRVNGGPIETAGALTWNDPWDLKTRAPCKAFNLRLEKGRTYQIDLRSEGFGPYLRLEDSQSKSLKEDRYVGGVLNARILFRCPQTGTYRIIASSDTMRLGDFKLKVQTD
jgi:WD40 repeat protein